MRRVSRRRSLGGEGAECKSADGSDAPRKERATASTGTFAIPRSWLPPANVPQTEHQHRMTIVTTRAQGNFDMAALPVTRRSRSSATRSIDNSLGGISSTGDPRLRGALPFSDFASGIAWIEGPLAPKRCAVPGPRISATRRSV